MVEKPELVIEKCSYLFERGDVAVIIVQASLDSQNLRKTLSGKTPKILTRIPDDFELLRGDAKRAYEELLRKTLGFRVKIPD